MKIGFCGPLDRMAEIAEGGFDYIEPAMNALAAMPEGDFLNCLARAKEAALPCPAFNCMFPGSLALLAPTTTDGEITRYLHGMFERVRALGGKIAVFGSGKSRMRPDGVPYGEAFRRLTAVTRLIGETAGQYGVTVVIEPLNRGETNMINSVGEGACLAAAVHHPSVSLLADYFHIAVENQPPEDILRVGGIAHAHIATKEGRRIPLEKEEGFERMFSAMKQTGYQGLISVEGRCDDLKKEGPLSIALLRELYTEA